MIVAKRIGFRNQTKERFHDQRKIGLLKQGNMTKFTADQGKRTN